jgi:hypothetical protein
MHKYTPEEIRFLEKYAAGRSYAKTAEMFNRRFGSSLHFLAIKNALQRRGLYNGRDGRFKPGHSYYSRPIGSERLDGNGYVVVKIANPSVWKYKHHVIWEKAHGEIPQGSVIIFADRNKQNCILDNLLLVSKRARMIMNHLGLISDNKDLTKAGKLIADLTLLINGRKRGTKKRRKSQPKGTG